MAVGGLSDAELLGRLSAIHNEAQVLEVATELAEARKKIRAGVAEESLASAIQHPISKAHLLGKLVHCVDAVHESVPTTFHQRVQGRVLGAHRTGIADFPSNCTSAVKFTEGNRFAEGNHAGMIDASIGAARCMAGHVSLLPNAVAVGVSAQDNKSCLWHPFGGLRDHLPSRLPTKAGKSQRIGIPALVPGGLRPGRDMREDDHAGRTFWHCCELFLKMLRAFLAKFPQPCGQIAGPEFGDQMLVIERHSGSIGITGRGIAPAAAPAKIDAPDKLQRHRLAPGLENDHPGPMMHRQFCTEVGDARVVIIVVPGDQGDHPRKHFHDPAKHPGENSGIGRVAT